jgi:hypothetical protein
MLQPLQWFKKLSRAARITILFSGVLCLLTIVAWIAFQVDPARVAWGDYMTLSRAGLLLLWLSLTTAATYFAAGQWLEERPASQDDIELAWQAGLNALSKVGLSLRDMPVFLLVGANSTQEQRQLLNASKQSLLVDGPAAGNAPLNWFASDQAIYVCCSSAGMLGTTVQNAGRAAHDPSQLLQTGFVSFNEQGGAATTEVGLASAENSVETGAVGQAGGGTATLVQPRRSAVRTEQQVETQLDALQSLVDGQLNTDAVGWQSHSDWTDTNMTPLTSTQVANCQRSLAEVCTRLRGARRPVAAINGIGVVVDVELATGSETAARQCGNAIQSDLNQIREALGQYAPVSLILTGMERQPGTTEAIRRLGGALSSQIVLGVVVDPREVCDRQRTGAIADRALGSLNQLIQRLMSDPLALSIPGNNHLLQLLIHARQRLSRPLQVLISQGLSALSVSTATHPSFFNGVFFSASGSRPIEQGFTAPIFDRMQAQQHWLSWTGQELRSQGRRQIVMAGLMLVCLAELLILGWQLWRQ